MTNPLPQTTILVVDDDRELRTALTLGLRGEGYSVVAVSDGQEALDTLRQGLRPCLILLDLEMPVLDGYQFRAVQREDAALAEIPTVLLTANQRAVDTARNLGCVLGLQKPIEWPRLAGIVSDHCPGCSIGR